MGYEARFIGGSAGRYGAGHAWVEYFHDGKWFLVEPLFCRIGFTMPRLSTLRYEPRYSVSWDGKNLRYFAHKKTLSSVPFRKVIRLLPEYVVFWSLASLNVFFHLPRIAWNILRKKISKGHLRPALKK
jgi:hypothetical protein